MEWVIAYGEWIFMVVTLALVAGGWGYLRYWRNREQLRGDLEELLAYGLDYLKVWAKDRLDEVTTDDIAEVSGWFYDHYVEGTGLAKLVTRERMYALLLEAFVHWRERFVGMNQAMVAYAAGVRRKGW